MAFRRAIVSVAVHSQASYCLHHAVASPPTLKPPPPPPPTLSCSVTIPCCSFAARPHHVKEVFKDNEDDAGPRLNNDITAIFLRLVTDEGHDVIPRYKALQIAIHWTSNRSGYNHLYEQRFTKSQAQNDTEISQAPDPIANPLLRILHPHADAAPTKAQRIGLHPSPPNPSPIPNPIPMEVEVKLRLYGPDDRAPSLAAATAALRVRLYGPDNRAPSRAVLALKRRARMDAGVSRVEEVEEPLDPEAERLRLDGDSQARHYREAEDKLGHGSRCRHRAPPAESYAIGSR
ncbi:hypothetical protein ZWY2020_014166 [Hordeum vulgare]|nr:hypothetical protein ZWY2020_014166 [Hordeum vulgare]